MKCIVTGELMVECEHCSDPDYIDMDESVIEYETLGRAFRTMYKGNCAVDYRHVIKKGDLVSKIRRQDNPLLYISGVACKNCTIMLPRGKD